MLYIPWLWHELILPGSWHHLDPALGHEVVVESVQDADMLIHSIPTKITDLEICQEDCLLHGDKATFCSELGERNFWTCLDQSIWFDVFDAAGIKPSRFFFLSSCWSMRDHIQKRSTTGNFNPVIISFVGPVPRVVRTVQVPCAQTQLATPPANC